MIREIIQGDITSPSNKSDIIIGMNSQLEDVRGIGRRFVKNRIPSRALDLGSVLTYDFDGTRRLHMIICHHLGYGGWESAEKYIRFGLDYLDHIDRTDLYGEGHREYSIVHIGTGHIGERDGADKMAIHAAMATSHLVMDLYKHNRIAVQVEVADNVVPLSPLRAWNWQAGEQPLLEAAA